MGVRVTETECGCQSDRDSIEGGTVKERVFMHHEPMKVLMDHDLINDHYHALICAISAINRFHHPVTTNLSLIDIVSQQKPHITRI